MNMQKKLWPLACKKEQMRI